MDGDHSLALEQMLRQYRHTLEEEYRVRFESFEPLLNKVRRYIRLYMEELLLKDDSAKQLSVVEKVWAHFVTCDAHFLPLVTLISSRKTHILAPVMHILAQAHTFWYERRIICHTWRTFCHVWRAFFHAISAAIMYQEMLNTWRDAYYV